MSDAWGDLAIVVVNYGSSALLTRNLVPLSPRRLPGVSCVVVDNFTSADERDRVRTLGSEHDWDVVLLDDNRGFGAGMNRGVDRAKQLGCTRFLLLNPDVTIDEATLRRLLQHSREHPEHTLSPTLVRPDGALWFAGGQIDRDRGLTRTRPDHVQEGDGRWLTGACLLVDEWCWDATGGFDERYFLYWEDIDLSQRILEGGGELEVLHDLVAAHEVGGTQGSNASIRPTYFECRNRLHFARANLAPSTYRRWLANAPRYAVAVARRHGRLPPRHVAAAVAGTMIGALGYPRG